MESPPHSPPPTYATARPALRFIMRWWWFVLLGAVAGAAFGYTQTANRPVVYQAEAVVVAPSTSLSTDTFDNVAKVVFQTDRVLGDVVTALGLNTTPRSLLTDHHLSIQTVPGAVAVRIVGRASDPVTARLLANAAATSFVEVGRDRGLGRLQGFQTSHNGVAQSRPMVKNAIVNGAAGAVVALAILLLIYVIRRPTMDEDQAREALRADSSFRAHARRLTGRSGSPETRPGSVEDPADGRVGSVEIVPTGLVLAVERAASANGAAPSDGSVRIVLIPRRGARGRAAAMVAEALAGQAAAVSGHEGGGVASDEEAGANSFSASTAGVLTAGDDPIGPPLTPATGVIVVVPGGATQRSLSQLEEELRVAPNVERRVVVLVE